MKQGGQCVVPTNLCSSRTKQHSPLLREAGCVQSHRAGGGAVSGRQGLLSLDKDASLLSSEGV